MAKNKDAKGNISTSTAIVPYKSTSGALEKTRGATEKLVEVYKKLNKEAERFHKTQTALARLSGKDVANKPGSELLPANVPDAHGGGGAPPSNGGTNTGLGNVPSPYGGKLAIAGQVATAVGAMAYGMMPSAAQAVSQRMSAQYVSSFSGRGITAASVITQGNAYNRGGFTSATSMTESAGAFLGAGYSFGSTTVSANMRQLGGMSVISGQTNQEVAAGIGSINGMSFLRIGVRARTASGGLRPINDIANDLYKRMYGGRTPTPEQAAAVMRPNSNAYRTIQQVAGGDPNLMLSLQTAIMAQARNKGAKLNTSDPGKMMDKMGLAADDPMRANFKYQTSEAGKLEATGSGLVSGYSTALGAAANINDQFTALAKTLGPVTEMFGKLKGFLETFPGLGGTGAAVSGFGNAATSSMMSIAQTRLAMSGLGSGNPATPGGAGGFFAGPGGKAIRGLGIAGGAIGVGTSAYSGYQTAKAGGGWDFGSILGGAMSGAMTGAMVGAPTGPGAIVGALVGALVGAGATAGAQYLGQQQSGGQGGSMPHEPVKVTAPVNDAVKYSKPLKNLHVTSPYGPRTFHGKKDFHPGIDFRAAIGTPVYAAAPGTVRKTGTGRGFGNYVQINHADGTASYYAHLSKEVVKSGKVKAGQLIGYSGNSDDTGQSTGPHLHFAVRKGGSYVNPTSWINAGGGNLEMPQDDNSGPLGFISSLWNSVTGFFSGDSQGSSSESSSYSSGSTLGPSSGSILSIGISGLQGSGVSGVLDLLGQGTTGSGLSGTLGSSASRASDSFDPGKTDRSVLQNYGTAKIGKRDLLKTLYSAGFRGKHLAEAYAIAMTESNGRPHAHNTVPPDDSYGIFQINMRQQKGLNAKARDASFKKHVQGYNSKADLFDPTINARVAAYMSRKGKNWSSWAADLTSSRYHQFLPSLAEVNRVIDSWQAGAQNKGAQAALNSGMGGGSVTMDQHSNASHGPITINMTVNVAKATEAEAKMLAQKIKKLLEEDEFTNRIGRN